jgi:hypothetical protein
MDEQAVVNPTQDIQARLGRKPRICILSLSNIPDDPRVRRQGDAFTEAGWDVIAIGLPGWRSSDPIWPVYTSDDVAPLEANQSPQTRAANDDDHESGGSSQPDRTRSFRCKVIRFAEAVLPTACLGPVKKFGRVAVLGSRELRYGLQAFGLSSGVELYLRGQEIRKFYLVASRFDADIYLANDWHMLPVAITRARECGSNFCYDTHEYALEEYKYLLRWRLTRRPLVRSIESVGLREALVASTVSQGIADDMKREYQLSRDIIEIRSVPKYTEVSVSPPGQFIEVLYHGIIVRDRGLEECIRSVPFWRKEFQFVLRGPASSEYRARLEGVAGSLGIADRVRFDEPVPMTELVQAASNSQIGIFTPPRSSKHNFYVLPNKFFEYIHAGLAICVSDLPDMAGIVRKYDLGRSVKKDLSPESIAEAINGFDRDSIARYGASSLAAAKILNWEMEENKLVGTYSTELLRRLKAG